MFVTKTDSKPEEIVNGLTETPNNLLPNLNSSQQQWTVQRNIYNELWYKHKQSVKISIIKKKEAIDKNR